MQTDERRRAPRRQPTQGTTCHLVIPGGEPRTALVWNISTSGISMLLAEKIEAGKEIRGELCPARGDGSTPITLRITHVSRIRTGDYFLGAQFQKPLSQEQMNPFLNS